MISKPQPAQQYRLDPETWVDRHADYMYRYALPRLRDPALAEEIVQETFLAALQSRDVFAGRSSERTWLVGILKHKIVDYFRRISRQTQLDPSDEAALEHDELFQQSGEWAGHFDPDLGPIEWRDPAAAMQQTEFLETLDRCLSSLPPRIASAFTLREMEELSTEEICKVLSVSTTNLWVMLHRARIHLRRCIEANWFRQ